MERLRLIPTQHWNGDELEGISVYVLDDEEHRFVGCLTVKPMDLEEVAQRAADHFQAASYSTVIELFGQEMAGEAKK